MIPQSQQRKPRNSSKVNLIISAVFHSVIVVALLYFAARQGYLGKKAKSLTVVMEKPAEKPKEPEKPKTEPEPPKVEVPKVEVAQKVEPPKAAAQPPPSVSTAPPAIAPPAVSVPFVFPGGAAVEESSDPVVLYKGQLESALRSRWERPEDIADRAYVVEVEVGVDPTGKIVNPVWKKDSGDKRWNDSVQQAIARTPGVNRKPPPNFPPRVIVRFDVVEVEPVLQP